MSRVERPRTDALPISGKLALLASLYVAQGLPFGFFTQTLPAVMRAQGYRLTTISYSALLTAPWALKFLWAPLVDRYPAPTPRVRARRTRWIVACQLAAVAAFSALAVHGRLDRLPPLFLAFALLNLVSATQDIATDGLAVDMLSSGERGYANGVQVAGYRAGMVIGGGLLLVILDRIGVRAGFIALAAASLALSIPLFFVHEAPPTVEEPTRVTGASARPPHFLTLRGAGSVLMIVVSYKLAESLAAGVFKPFLIDRGFSLTDLGAISGVAGSTGGLLGALTGGVLASRLGRRAALTGAAIFQSATVFLFAIAVVGHFGKAALSGVCFVEAFASSLATATLFTVMMDWCRPVVGATDYTVQASAVVIASGMATLLAGRLADAVGYATHFTVAGLVGIGSVFLLLFAYPAHAPEERPRSPERA